MNDKTLELYVIDNPDWTTKYWEVECETASGVCRTKYIRQSESPDMLQAIRVACCDYVHELGFIVKPGDLVVEHRHGCVDSMGYAYYEVWFNAITSWIALPNWVECTMFELWTAPEW